MQNRIALMNNKSLTSKFRIPHSKFIVLLFRQVAGKWLWIPVSILIISITLGITLDMRYLIVALMALLILTPMLLAFLYFYYGLAPGCWTNIIEKELNISTQGIELLMYISQKESSEKGCEETVIKRKQTIKWTDIRTLKLSPNSVTLLLKKDYKGFIIIPHSAFTDDESQRKFTDAILKNTN